MTTTPTSRSANLRHLVSANLLAFGLTSPSLATSSPPVALVSFPPGVAAPREAADSPAVRLTLEQVKAKLSGAAQGRAPELANADLSGLDLTGIDFKRASLTGSRLVESKLIGANLFSCDLTDAVLTGADLSRANLDGTVLRRADFQRANLQGASLFATIIEAADL